MTIVAYLRISHDPNGTQIGVSRQRKDCRAIAELRWPRNPLVEIVDNDVSAYSRKPRPGYQQLLKLVEEGEVTGVVAYSLDRLLRQPRELEQLIDLGVPIVTAQGDLDLTTHDGQLQARILAAVAAKSSDDSSRRIKRAHKERAEQGLWHGGRYIPFGYARGDQPGVLVVVPEHAATINAVARSVVEGDTLAAAIRRHVEGATGGDSRQYLVDGRPLAGGVGGAAPHTREAWRLILTGPIVRGFNSKWQPAAWPAIIDEETGAILTDALAKHSRTRRNKKWPLSGLARCGKCTGKLYGTVNRNYHSYSCRVVGCHGVSIDSRLLEQDVRMALDSMTVVKPREERPVRDNGALQRLEYVTAQYLAGEVPVGVWEMAKREYAKSATPERPRVVRRPVEPGGVFPMERAYEVISRIVVTPVGKGGSYDPDRVKIIWRH